MAGFALYAAAFAVLLTPDGIYLSSGVKVVKRLPSPDVWQIRWDSGAGKIVGLSDDNKLIAISKDGSAKLVADLGNAFDSSSIHVGHIRCFAVEPHDAGYLIQDRSFGIYEYRLEARTMTSVVDRGELLRETHLPLNERQTPEESMIALSPDGVNFAFSLPAGLHGIDGVPAQCYLYSRNRKVIRAIGEGYPVGWTKAGLFIYDGFDKRLRILNSKGAVVREKRGEFMPVLDAQGHVWISPRGDASMLQRRMLRELDDAFKETGRVIKLPRYASGARQFLVTSIDPSFVGH